MENGVNLFFGIMKALLWFAFRILLLGPMIVLTVVMAMLGGDSNSVGQAVWKCICQPFTAFFDAVRSISYEIKVYNQNKLQ